MSETRAAGDHYINVIEFGEQMDKGILLFDIEQQKITYYNARAELLLGSLETITGVNYFPLLARVLPEHQHYVQEQFQLLLHQKQSCEIKFHLNPDADKASLLLLTCTIYYLVKSSQLLLFIEDITASNAQEEFLVEYGTKKNTMLETMTHHFSGALMLMQQLTRQVEKNIGASASEELMRYLNLLSANAESCVSMMDNLLKEENLRAPEIAVKIERVEIVERLRYIYDNLIKAFPSRNIIFDTVSPSVYVDTDEFKVLQIINNFIFNAIKFTPANKQIVISIYQTQDNIIISVEDEGIGIPE